MRCRLARSRMLTTTTWGRQVRTRYIAIQHLGPFTRSQCRQSHRVSPVVQSLASMRMWITKSISSSSTRPAILGTSEAHSSTSTHPPNCSGSQTKFINYILYKRTGYMLTSWPLRASSSKSGKSMTKNKMSNSSVI
jgi:hypothetical protein